MLFISYEAVGEIILDSTFCMVAAFGDSNLVIVEYVWPVCFYNRASF